MRVSLLYAAVAIGKIDDKLYIIFYTYIKMDARHNASATTKIREVTMCDLFNGHITQETSLTMFPCPPEVIRNFRTTFLQKVPSQKSTSVIGGLGKHYDMETLTASNPMRGELKVTSGTPSALEILKFQPWKDTVQFLQGQYKSKLGKRFLGECGDPMMIAWYETVVKGFSVSVPTSAGMTCNGYLKAMSTIGMVGKQERAAMNFISALRSDGDLQANLQKEWLAFETRWLSSHAMNHEVLLEVIKEIIEVKDYWVCVSKSQVNWVDGLKVIKLDFVGPKPKPKGGMSFHYLLTVKSGSDEKQVPMEVKFHWKNGGQAVQNLNFMIL